MILQRRQSRDGTLVHQDSSADAMATIRRDDASQGAVSIVATSLVVASRVLGPLVEGRLAALRPLERVAGPYRVPRRACGRRCRTLGERLATRPWSDRLQHPRNYSRSRESARDVLLEVRS